MVGWTRKDLGNNIMQRMQNCNVIDFETLSGYSVNGSLLEFVLIFCEPHGMLF